MITVNNYEYKIDTDHPILLRRKQQQPLALQLQNLFKRKKLVKNSDICVELEVSRRTATRLLLKAEQDGYIKKVGSGTRTKYTARRSLYL